MNEKKLRCRQTVYNWYARDNRSETRLNRFFPPVHSLFIVKKNWRFAVENIKVIRYRAGKGKKTTSETVKSKLAVKLNNDAQQFMTDLSYFRRAVYRYSYLNVHKRKLASSSDAAVLSLTHTLFLPLSAWPHANSDVPSISKHYYSLASKRNHRKKAKTNDILMMIIRAGQNTCLPLCRNAMI